MKSLISDQEIINRLKTGNSRERSRVMGLLYTRYFAQVRKLVTTNSGSTDDAADIFQDSLVIFYLKLKKGEYVQRSNIGTYLFAISRNLWLKKLRKSGFDLKKLEQEEHYDFDDEAVLQKRQITIREALAALGENCKSILVDFYFRKIPMAQLKDRHGVNSMEAARNKKYRCMQKLLAFVRQHKLKRSDFKDE